MSVISNMNRRTALLTLTLAISGCATYAPSIPENYTGPKALLEDSVLGHSTSKADFFVAEALDDKKIDNSLNETLRRNKGSGMAMSPFLIDRSIPAGKTIKILVRGRTHFAAPIQALIGTVYQVQGTVEFTPKPSGSYVVKGELGENYSAVWIEETATKTTVGQKIEVNGSAKLGVLEK